MAADNYSGVNSLANVISNRIRNMTESPLMLDYGTIKGDMSLRTDTFPIALPQSDYTVCRQLTLGATGDKLTNTSVNGEHAHSHDVYLPEKMRGLKPGDRVLVAWVNNDACVIDIILPA